MKNQAEALVMSVARGGEKGLIAYQIQQRKITEHLLTLARSIDKLERIGNLDKSLIREIYGSDNLKMVDLWNRQGNFRQRILAESEFENSGAIGDRLAPILNGQSDELRLGLIEFDGKSSACLAVAVKKSSGGAIVVGIDAEELLVLRRSFGTGSVIDHISESEGIEYAAIMEDGTILAASRKFPIGEKDPWLGNDNFDGIKTRITGSNSDVFESVFEIISPFTVAGERYGSIVLGISTKHMELLTAKLRRDILWRSILFLVVAVIAITGIMIRQNYRLLSVRYDEIKSDVQILEADKSRNEKLTAMGELASGVAHEVRNPLNTIRVIIQRLQREFKPSQEPEEYHELTALLINETDRINDTVKQFLKMAKPPVLHKFPGDINDCLDGIISLIEPRAAARGCKLEKNFGKLPEFEFDPELCKQGILNLLDNALNAIEIDGIIKISTFRKGQNCRIEIEDNGPGIPDENKNRVFDMYFTTRDEGTGMGLPTVLRIVKEHKGMIDLLDSELGGALFRLELPIE